VTLNQRGAAPISNRMIALALALLGIAGWGAYFHSSQSYTVLEDQLRVQSTALQDYQTRNAALLQKAEESARDIAGLRGELATARSEIQRLSIRAKEADAALEQVKEREGSSLSSTGGISPHVLSITPRPTKEDVMAAQHALTQLRFGTLDADGVIGQSTRQAIEEFQRAAGLQVTGELHAQTLLALTRAAKVMAAQAERLQ